MSQLSSKLANSVRQAKAQQQDDQQAPEEPSQDMPANTSSQPEPQVETPRRPAKTRRAAEEPPLPEMPSRRVWPD